MRLRWTFYFFTAVVLACFGLRELEARFTAATTTPVIALSYDGSLRDRVGQNTLAPNPDGQLDGTFTVTLNAGSGSRTVTRLVLVNGAGGVWDTDGGDAFWTLGVANGLNAALVNGNNDAVNLQVADGGEFKIFASEFQNQMFLSGTPFTLFVDFSDGSSATASLTIALSGPPVVTLAATTPTAFEGGGGGAFTVTRMGTAASALTVNYTVGGTAVAGTHYAALSGSAVIAAGSVTGTIVVAPVENSFADGDKTVIVALSADAAYIVGSPSIATATVHDDDGMIGPAAITVRSDGLIRDRVGQNDLSRNPDGQLDGTFTVTLSAGSGNRTVTQLQLRNTAGNEWNTQGGDGLWTLGAASGWDAALVNGNNDALNLPVADGGEFKIFGADYQNRLFLPGSPFTLTAVFSDGSSATGSVTTGLHDNGGEGTAAITVQFDGLIRDRVGQNDLSRNPDGQPDGTFTVTLNAGSGSRTVTHLQLKNTAGNEWNTQGGDGLWTLGAANGLDAALVNGNSDAVNFQVADGGEFQIFGSDYQNRLFLPGSAFTVAVGFSDGSTATGNVTLGTTGPAAIALRFDGSIRDRVDRNNLSRKPDGQLDGTFTVTMNVGSGSRTVANLLLANSAGGGWNTDGSDGLWTLGAASGWDAVLVNGNNDDVHFPVADGGEFKIFASDFQSRMFVPGTVFTLIVTFSDGSTATANLTIPVLPTVTIVATLANAFEGGANGLFTVTRSANTGAPLAVNYTVGGTAVAGTHYAALSGSALIPVNALSSTIAVVPLENNIADGDETVVVTVSASGVYTVGSPTATITVHDNDVPPGAVLTSLPGIAAPGTTITASWNGIRSPTTKDWIGLFAAGAGDGSALAWMYVSCTQIEGSASASGACPFVLPGSLANGVYELRLFSNGGSLRLATGLPFAVTLLDTNIFITAPERSVAAAPKVATRSIAREECNTVFSIPYIQTGNILTFNAAVRSMPNGGGVVFSLSDGLGGQLTQWSQSPPFSATYTGLAKGEYRLDAYIVDSGGNGVPGELNHDYATSIGLGDIYVAIGDSITEGYDGDAYNTPPYTNWLQAPVASHDFRNYPQCGISTGFSQDHWQEVSHHISLNNELEAFNRYPVFILNDGVSAMTTGYYLIRMNTGQWQDRIAALQPNKWLIHLGTNDGTGGSAGFQTDMQSIVERLKGAYAAGGKDIVLAVPQLGENWQPSIDNLISANGLTPGPDFNTFYYYNGRFYPKGHPNAEGHEQYARLFAISIMSPRNVAVQQVTSGRLSVSWDDLQLLEPTIAGYKVYYGTNPASLTNVVDVGHVTTTLFDVPVTGNPTYFFAVQGYDHGFNPITPTSLSNPVGFTIGN